ncbi:hypothetical protein PS710_00387 [Pseudomonas fluorescens]|uniref:4-hydroxybenzoate transporter PcaK n=1 Tax=Pseudomonas fluorescens TaxID=294 RepID=A0A5E6ZVA1_PSEFL|nr:hypothetical protein PS710_00387 [Pseudomonas fluorescens]
MNAQTVDIKQWIDDRSMSRYQWLILFLCFLIVTFDGFDAAIMGFIAPAVIQDWAISRSAFGPILAAAMVCRPSWRPSRSSPALRHALSSLRLN